MSTENFARVWHDDRVHSVAVYLRADHHAEEVTKALRSRFGLDRHFTIFSNQLLRRRIFEIFDQTFAVTHVLLAISLFVAITGIFLALTILITERRRELAILRAIGASAGQIRKLLLSETAMPLLFSIRISSSSCRLVERVYELTKKAERLLSIQEANLSSSP